MLGPAGHAYGYDYKYQLSNATFGRRNTTTNAFTSSPGKYDMYDLNGHIT
ncbi:MAG: hypothetical protein H7259_01215 [Cytophagales bacterium]|nr:hypothetical protein [Cytophaga sp.]